MEKLTGSKREIQIAWAAGMLEGEGSFCVVKDKRFNCARLCISVDSKDKETVAYLQKIFGGTLHGPYKANRQNPNQQPLFKWQICRKKDVALVLNDVYDFLSSRRKVQADKILDYLSREQERIDLRYFKRYGKVRPKSLGEKVE
jgi:hypothetical protein